MSSTHVVVDSRDRVTIRRHVQIAWLTLLLVASAVAARAQEAPPAVDFFAGYSLLPSKFVDDFPRGTSHGAQFAVTAHVNRWFGVGVDVGVQFNTNADLGPNFAGLVSRSRVTELLAVPRFTARSPRVDTFVHGLVGMVYGDAGPGFEGFSDNQPAFGGGAGIDIRLNRASAVRVQYDLFGTFADIVEGNSRFAIGLVLR
jgi:hypothetical protein